MLIVFSPVLLVVYIWLTISNKGAGAFFFQERPGKDGKLFKVLVSNRNPETGKYEQTYSGSKMPEKYSVALEGINYKVGRWKRLFNELDGDTFH